MPDMPGYLEEAAAQLRLARDGNERRAAVAERRAARIPAGDDLAEVNDRRMACPAPGTE